MLRRKECKAESHKLHVHLDDKIVYQLQTHACISFCLVSTLFSHRRKPTVDFVYEYYDEFKRGFPTIYLAWSVVCLPNVIKTTAWFRTLYIISLALRRFNDLECPFSSKCT